MAQAIGILGGTFNPVHAGHLLLAQDALEHFELDRIVFVPCGRPPHKPELPVAAARHRLAMLEAAVEGDPRFEVSTCEIERDGPSYSVDTVRHFRGLHPGARLCLVIGADTLVDLRSWHEIGRLLEACDVVTVSRPGLDLARLRAPDLGLPPPWGERLLAQAATGHDVGISSSEVRMRLAEGLSIRYLVPPPVEMYIGEHGLYRD